MKLKFSNEDGHGLYVEAEFRRVIDGDGNHVLQIQFMSTPSKSVAKGEGELEVTQKDLDWLLDAFRSRGVIKPEKVYGEPSNVTALPVRGRPPAPKTPNKTRKR